MSLLLPDVALAGNPCAAIKVENDKFTGQRTATRDGWLGTGPERATWNITVAENRVTWTLALSTKGENDAALPVGQQVLVALVNGDQLRFTASASTTPTSDLRDRLVITSWPVRLDIDSENLRKLASNDVAAVRTETPIGTKTWEAGKGDQQLIKHTFSCAVTLTETNP